MNSGYGPEIALNILGVILAVGGFYGATFGILWSLAPPPALDEQGRVDNKEVAKLAAIVTGYAAAFALYTGLIGTSLFAIFSGKKHKKTSRRARRSPAVRSMGSPVSFRSASRSPLQGF